MPSHTVTLDIPSGLFTRLQKRAEQTNRSIEDETLEVLATTVAPDDLSADLQQTLASLHLLDDSDIERVARSGLATELSAELETLHLKQQREGLTEGESHRCAELLRAYERSMLLRAQAAALLKRSGIDVSPWVAPP